MAQSQKVSTKPSSNRDWIKATVNKDDAIVRGLVDSLKEAFKEFPPNI